YFDRVTTQAADGTYAGEDFDQSLPAEYKEYAAFTDLTYHFTERFDVQVGGRESKITATTPTREAKANAFTYLFTPRLKLSPDVTLYARLASGYRPGTPNPEPACEEPGIPCSFSPDKTYNYDLGLKGDFLDRLLSVDVSLYYVNWKDIQIQLTSPAPYL